MARTPSVMIALGSSLPAFRLENTVDGKWISDTDFSQRPILVMFLCNHCPFVKHIREKISEIGNEFQKKGFGVVAISANDPAGYPQDGPEKMKEEAIEAGYEFPYLFDASQEVAKSFQAACTPDFFVYDKEHRLAYRGQFDGSRPGNSVAVSGADLRASMLAIFDGKKPSEKQVPSLGCNIKWRAGNEPRY